MSNTEPDMKVIRRGKYHLSYKYEKNIITVHGLIIHI